MNEIISNLTIKDTGWSKISKFDIFFINFTFIFMDIMIPYLVLYIFPLFIKGRITSNIFIPIAIIYNTPLIYLIILLPRLKNCPNCNTVFKFISNKYENANYIK